MRTLAPLKGRTISCITHGRRGELALIDIAPGADPVPNDEGTASNAGGLR